MFLWSPVPHARARVDLAADRARNSGKGQGHYPTPPVQTGHNAHSDLSLFCSIQLVLAAYYEISDRSLLGLAGMLDKTKVPPGRV